MSETTFTPGDIIVMDGETYQVIEDQGTHGIILPFPVVEGIEGEEMEWGTKKAECRKIGAAKLPAPSACATTGSCPTNGRLDETDSTTSHPDLIAKG